MLSIVAQVFALVPFICMCAGEDVPPFDDTDDDYQWKVQTDAGWVPYWDS
jgi:hypothetical protein